jgi:hypothetical protein
MKFAGMVTVTGMGPCPPIQKGKGRVVTMTVTHENSHVFELELSGFDAQGRAITETQITAIDRTAAVIKS